MNVDCVCHNYNLHLQELKFKFASSVIPLGSLIYGNSFEASLLFKALADQFDIPATFVLDSYGCRGWNEVCYGDSNILDLFFDVGEIYEKSSVEGKNYLKKIQ